MSHGAAPAAASRRRSTPAPFARVVCALDGGPVLVARERALARGIVAARRGHPADCAALAAAKRLAELLGAPLTVADATGSDAPAGAIVAAAKDAGLLVLGSSDLRRLRPLAGTSERVAHLAPCTVLLTRGS
ncbi:MAG TPA: universal stress protein [Solirubrobacter sp.]|nr:universal stress protein [Solirubrobacter sp.]